MNVGPQEKPLILWDGDCGFCRFWIQRYSCYTKERVKCSSFQEAGGRFPQIPRERFQSAVHLIEADGRVYAGAGAVFRILAYRPVWSWLPWFYDHAPGVAGISEFGYRMVATHRAFFGFWTGLLWGRRPEPDTFFLARFFFLRLLGLIFLSAFLSLWFQVDGLVGPEGILPAGPFLKAVFSHYGAQSYFLVPSVFWLGSGPTALHLVCGLGVAASVLLVLGQFETLSLGIAWLFYLSFVSICREFLSFQWDVLLLEAGLLAIFLKSKPASLIEFLFKWLLFRLMFMSGMVKLLSHDDTWSNLTALTFHYQTQPLPVWASWYVHHLPGWFHKASCAGMFFIELALPFLIFAPRKPRHAAGAGIIFLQTLIFLTGNYAFFNLLTLALCLFLFEDTVFPANWRKKWGDQREKDSLLDHKWTRWLLVPFAGVALISSGFMFTNRLDVRFPWPGLAMEITRLTLPFHSFNPYGLFAVMTTRRLEIEVQGTRDGKTWIPYEFKYKPGGVNRRPVFVEPHQPRLDWQMWFAALGSPRDNPWFLSFVQRLLQGSPSVLGLLQSNPFPEAPPVAIRAILYEYRFTTAEQRRQTGAWWDRDDQGLYLMPISLREVPHRS